MSLELNVVGPPFSHEDLSASLAVIGEGCAVDLNSATAALPLAMRLAITRDTGTIVAVGAIKHQRPDYAASVAQKSGFSFPQDTHELGYVAVRQSHRGLKLSRKITVALLESFARRPLFATTAHPAMKKVLAEAGFVAKGKEWAGQKDTLSLWILPTPGSVS